MKLPCVNRMELAAVRVPRPTCRPDGNRRLLSGSGARLQQVLIHQVLKLGAPRFVSRGVGVGQVVGDVVEIGLLSVHSARGTIESTNHLGSFIYGFNFRDFRDSLFIHVRAKHDGLL